MGAGNFYLKGPKKGGAWRILLKRWGGGEFYLGGGLPGKGRGVKISRGVHTLLELWFEKDGRIANFECNIL